MLDPQTVEHIALLARIGITDSERDQYQGELTRILDFVEELKAFENKTAPSRDESLIRYQVARTDSARGSSTEEREGILKNMPEVKDGALKVRQVL